MLAFKMLIYALVNSAFSGIASLKLDLFIQPPNRMGMTNLLFSHPHLIDTYYRVVTPRRSIYVRSGRQQLRKQHRQ